MSNKVTTGRLIFSAIHILFWPALILLISGDWSWLEGWIFGIWFVLMAVIITTYLYFKDPALLAERFRLRGTGNQKTWDNYFVFAMTIIFFAWLVLMPLDAKRLSWSVNFAFAWKIIGIAFLLLSFFFLFRSFKDNTFLSPLVRIQTERKQQVVTTGVYAIVRHPMYLGGLLMFIGTPLLMGSWFGLALGLVMTILIEFRAVGEERMLMKEFKDYADYKKKVKYRFIPLVW